MNCVGTLCIRSPLCLRRAHIRKMQFLLHRNVFAVQMTVLAQRRFGQQPEILPPLVLKFKHRSEVTTQMQLNMDRRAKQ